MLRLSLLFKRFRFFSKRGPSFKICLFGDAPQMLTSGSQSCSRRLTLFFLLSALLLAIPATSFAQGYFGTVSGVVTDPSGAVIANAKVTLYDQEKGFTFDGKSDGAGRYIFRAVPPGVYRVVAEAPGFAQQEKTNIRVDVSTNPSANLRMKIGSTTSVVVTADDQRLDTDDGTGATTINRNLINNLPLIDRSVMELAYLAPGTTNVDDQCDINCTGTNFTSNGSRNSTADVLMDGATVTNFEPNGGSNANHVCTLAGSGGRDARRAVELQRRVWFFWRLGREHGHAFRHRSVSWGSLRLCPQYHYRRKQLVQ